MSEPRTEAGKRLLLDCDDMDWLEMRERILAIEAEAAPHPLDGLREALLAEGIEAFRLTREYVGEDTLPALPGWSWFDWTEKARAALRDEGETT